MALTFTAWDSYTDESGRACTLDWTPGAAGLSLRPHLEAIRQAIVERAHGARYYTSLSATLKTEVPAGDLASYSPVVSAIQEAVTSLITLYVNHTDNGGNWDGQTGTGTTVGPPWSVAALLADIAPGTTRLEQKLAGRMAAAWIVQQRQILDRLRWYRAIGVTGIMGYVTSGYRNVSSQPDWATAVAAWNAASWASPATSGPGHHATLSSGGITINRRRGQLFAQQLVTAAFRAIVQPYHRFGPQMVGHVYENPDYAYTNGQWHLIGTSAPLAARETEGMGTYGDISSVTVSEPTVMGSGRGWILGDMNYIAIYQYNCTGGFTFQP